MAHQHNTIPCPHCGARYKAPHAIPKEGGLITCAQCSETFTIFPEKEEEDVVKPRDEQIYNQLPNDPFADIFVMKEDGTILSIASQALLQQRIVTMTVGKNDSWSKDKKAWTPLADEATLAPFFDLVSLKVTLGDSVAPGPQPLPPLTFNSDEEIEESRKISKTKPPQSITKEVLSPATKKVEETFLPDEFGEYDFDDEEKSNTTIIILIVALIVIGGGIALYFFTDLFKTTSNTTATEKIEEKKVEETVVEKIVVEEKVETPAETTEEKKAEATVEKSSDKKESVAKTPIQETKKVTPTVTKKTPKKPKKQVSAKSLVRYGWKLIDRGNSKKAIRMFRKAIKINPAFAESYYGLAEAYGALGNTKKAKMYYKECLTHNPTPSQKNEVQRILNNL